MLKRLILIGMICFMSVGFQLSSCQTQQDDRIIVMSPDVHADLVYFFKRGTTDDQIFDFGRTVTGIPNGNSGFSDLPGIMTGVRVTISGFVGEAINFQPDATAEQKAFVKKRVLDSPLIYKVYENVVPNRISDL
jgi:hypothetical protein